MDDDYVATFEEEDSDSDEVSVEAEDGIEEYDAVDYDEDDEANLFQSALTGLHRSVYKKFIFLITSCLTCSAFCIVTMYVR